MTHTLVLAYGNSLRGDDGVGRLAGEEVARWGIPDVKVVIMQQLVPELIVEMKYAGRVLFIDSATPGCFDEPFECHQVKPERRVGPLGHHETPARLLDVLRILEGQAPETWMVSITGESFEHGEQISEPARENLRAALDWVHNWLTESACTRSA
jgi:hydrogenase maturation protease